MKILILISRIITGGAFIFSGFVKAVDPMGSAYKFQDYFSAFNLAFLSDASLLFSVLLCTTEFLAGFCVLTGIRLRAGISVTMLLMVIFTPLTLFLAIKNPVTDCGCFGDAIKLTNWQTFLKNLVLITFTSILFFNRKKLKHDSLPYNIGLISLTTVIFLLFAFYNLRNLPVIDFLPYKKGVRISDQMTIPEGSSPDKYETTFLYEKDGVIKEFDLSNYPADDTTWKFIDQKSVLTEKGYVPPIHDFVVVNESGEDITSDLLSHPGFTLLLISKKISEADDDLISKGLDYGRHVMNNGAEFYVFTASGKDETAPFEEEFAICTVDETTLKTMVRANPGFMLIHNGVIKEKWSSATLPEKEWFSDTIKNDINFKSK